MATAGRNGVVKIGTTAIGSVRSWSLDHTSDTIDVTTMSTTGNYREFVPSLKTWSGSISVVWDEADAGQDAAVLGTEITIKVYPDDDGTGDVYYTGSAIITSVSQSASYDGLVERTINFNGTGALSSTVQS
mgnify:FL=1